MTRPLTNTVQYFFHSCEHGKTMFILEQRFGNDGYAFWFKLLETLGSAENHFLDLSDPLTFECLQAKAKIKDRITMSSYLDLLALLQAINPELWKFGIVWSQNFVDGLDVVYKNRKREIPQKPVTTGKIPFSISSYPAQEGITTVVIPLGNIGSIGNIGMKELKTAREKSPAPPQSEAVKIYRDIFKLNPRQVQAEEINATIKGNGDLEAWKEACRAWAMNGNKPTNIRGILDWFKSGCKTNYLAIVQRPGKQTQAEKNAIVDSAMEKIKLAREQNITPEAKKLNG